MPVMFALGVQVIGNPTTATFAAFGLFGMLLLADFGGTMRERLAAQASLVGAGCVLICLGTLASRNAWLSAAVMMVVGFLVLFADIVSSVFAATSTAEVGQAVRAVQIAAATLLDHTAKALGPGRGPEDSLQQHLDDLVREREDMERVATDALPRLEFRCRVHDTASNTCRLGH